MWEHGFSVDAATEHAERHARMPPRPGSDPDMPDDITRISGDQLGTLHAQFVAMADYLEGQVGLADIAAAEEEAYLEHVKAAIRLRKSGTVADKDAKTLNDETFIEAEMSTLRASARAKLLKARLRGYDKCAAALSREITRREKLMEQQR